MAEARQLGPYRLVERLGAGAMGEVWRAVDTRLDRQVAVKILPPGTDDHDARARLLREAKAAAAVPHPSVVALYDVGTDDETDYLVMEIVEGRTLASILFSGALPPARALDVALGLADALAAAHARGILHRDVKPANLMITPDGRLKVLDFGIARLRALRGGPGESNAPTVAWREARRRFSGAMDATLPSGDESGATREGTLLGTPAYFSPEQVAGKLPDERSEVFSAGLVAYEAFTGKNPFHAPTFDELFRNLLELEPAPIDAPAPVRDVIMKAIARAPADRHASMAAFADALRAARETLEQRRRRPWPWIAAAAVVAAAVAAGGVYLATRRPPPTPADQKLAQALGEYDVFFNEKAAATLRAARKLAPDDPRPLAYLILMGYADDDELRAAAATLAATAPKGSKKDRALAATAVALLAEGPAAARAKLGDDDTVRADRELAFWWSELSFRANDCGAALAGYDAILARPGDTFRGRAYDHQVACLLDRDDFAAAVRAGDAYARAYPGEPDAIGTQATALAAAGQLDAALTLAKEALALARTEDTIAGLAKVHALRGEIRAAATLYEEAITRAPDYRRPLRRAALGALLLMNDRVDEARAAVEPCLPGGPDADRRTSTVCWFVAGLADETRAPTLIPALEARAHPAPPSVPYGRPDALARVLAARVALGVDDDLTPAEAEHAFTSLAGADDLYLNYHLPFLASYTQRLRAQIYVMSGQPAEAIPELERLLERRPADAPTLLQLAGAQVAAGQRGAAMKTLDKLTALWPTADPDGHVPARALKLRKTLSVL